MIYYAQIINSLPTPIQKSLSEIEFKDNKFPNDWAHFHSPKIKNKLSIYRLFSKSKK
jgi:hypothetical protein